MLGVEIRVGIIKAGKNEALHCYAICRCGKQWKDLFYLVSGVITSKRQLGSF